MKRLFSENSFAENFPIFQSLKILEFFMRKNLNLTEKDILGNNIFLNTSTTSLLFSFTDVEKITFFQKKKQLSFVFVKSYHSIDFYGKFAIASL